MVWHFQLIQLKFKKIYNKWNRQTIEWNVMDNIYNFGISGQFLARAINYVIWKDYSIPRF